MTKTLQSAWDDFINLLYPNLCIACAEHTPPKKEFACVRCQYHLTKTTFHLEKENPFTERFWGRIPLHAGAALYRFTKGGRAQKIIYNLKYEGRFDIGVKLGRLYGADIANAPLFKDIDYIVPVPLHSRKLKMRGYNQSDAFAKGLSETMHIPWLKKGLVRVEFTETQTKKTREERFENVKRAFEVGEAQKLEGKHILIVDDVITTGATLEACAAKVLEIPNTKVSLVTIALANF